MPFRMSRSIRNRISQFYRTYTSHLSEVSKTKDAEVPEQAKERILDRWAKYWKNLYIDYKDVGKDVVVGCKERPVRASFYFSSLGVGYYLSKHNPDAVCYREMLLEASNKLIMVGEAIRNPVSVRHLKSIEQCYNEGTINRLSLGIVSFMWLDNYEKDCAHYKAMCSYLKPQFLGFHHRIVDVGFMDKWWMLEEKMKDFDINESEFTDSASSSV